ncbi:phosphate ABC transporter permease PstA [Parvibaculum sp.]|uniref:phosphate ABC transporter permease PstA n=1 Tax=Parvibaculum sp. TaxID=2024848 RepID=UPI00320C99EC
MNSKASSIAVVTRKKASDLTARGEPMVWAMGGSLAFGLMMVMGFLALIFWNGFTAFWPKPVDVVTLNDGRVIAGEPMRAESYRPTQEALQKLPAAVQAEIREHGGLASRTLYRIGNYDYYANDFDWVSAFDVKSVAAPKDIMLVERQEWGVLIGRLTSLTIDGKAHSNPDLAAIDAAHRKARTLRAERIAIEKDELGEVNREINDLRLSVRRAEIDYGTGSPEMKAAEVHAAEETQRLNGQFETLSAKVLAVREKEEAITVTGAEIGGQTKDFPLGNFVRYYAPNDLSLAQKVGVYISRWWEFLSTEPREANTEGGVWPAIFGTFVMTVVMSVLVAPFGVIAALYLREYAKQGRIVALVRICVNNLAGVPSIVYGVFGLGFFAYVLGGSIDHLFFPERLPSPTFGTGGLLWASLTMALLTVPVVIVSTEEALAAVPRSMREGSLACGASKWQTIKWIVLPRAMPGIMTGLILAMARGAGEVAPLMIVGVVKLAPELPLDGAFPFIHLERSFMHLGFHIYDVGFQSRNSEAGRSMVFVTALVLMALVLALNTFSINVRNRLKRKFAGDKF